MAFLDKSVTVFVDAVLTELGRQQLATAGNLNISKFALADDGVDYNLFDVTHSSGPDYYDNAILFGNQHLVISSYNIPNDE